MPPQLVEQRDHRAQRPAVRTGQQPQGAGAAPRSASSTRRPSPSRSRRGSPPGRGRRGPSRRPPARRCSGRPAIPGIVSTTPDHARVVGKEIVRGDPVQHGGLRRVAALQVAFAGAEHVAHLAEVAPDQVFRRRAGHAQGDVGVAPAEVGKVVGGRQLQLQGRIARHEARQRRQQQAMQDGVGAGQAHGTAEHLAPSSRPMRAASSACSASSACCARRRAVWFAR